MGSTFSSRRRAIPPRGSSTRRLRSRHGRHVVMVNVEADVLAGPLLARRARERGLVYSMAYGDQPALIAELVDWARTAGFEVVAAGKGTKYLPAYHASTPGYGLGSLRLFARAGRLRRFQRAHVQFLPRRHEIGDRNGRRRQRDGPRAARRRPRLPALRRRRSAACAAAARGRRVAAQGEASSRLSPL